MGTIHKDAAIQKAVERLYPELPDLGTDREFCELFRVLLLQGREGKSIRTAVNKLLMSHKPAKEHFLAFLSDHGATTKSATRSAAAARKLDAEDDSFQSEAPQTGQVLDFPNQGAAAEKDVSQEPKIDSKADYLLSLIRVLFNEGGQRDALLKELTEAFRNILEEQNIPEDIHDALTIGFMSSVHDALEKHDKRILLPEKPPEMWKSGQGKTALQFLQEIYKPWLEAKVLTWKWLREKDPKLAKAASVAISRTADVDENMLPLTESDLIDREHDYLVETYGKEVVDRIYRVKSSLFSRKARQSSNKSLEHTLE